jgi:hypothetical protein
VLLLVCMPVSIHLLVGTHQVRLKVWLNILVGVFAITVLQCLELFENKTAHEAPDSANCGVVFLVTISRQPLFDVHTIVPMTDVCKNLLTSVRTHRMKLCHVHAHCMFKGNHHLGFRV